MHALHVSCYLDPQDRSPEELLTAWPTLTDVTAAVVRYGVKVTVVQAASRDAILERNGVACRFVRTNRQSMITASTALARRAAALDPDLIHLHGLSFPIQARLLGRSMPGVPMLVQDHAGSPPSWWKRPVHRWGLAKIAGVAFTSRAQARPFVDAGVLHPRVRVFEVLESSSHFTPGDRAASRIKTGLYGDPCLIWVGRLDENKDPLTVLTALRIALPELNDPQLWCCFTAAPLLDAVRTRLSNDPLLAGRVHLLDRVPHEKVEELCRAADFLVLGSHHEGSGYAVIEALACGTSPLVTDIPSFRRITADGAFGALSPPGDAEAMAHAIVEWSRRDPDKLRRAARAHFERALSFDVVGAELRTAYERIIERA